MSKHLKKFNTHTQYQTFSLTDMVLPNVSHCVTEQHVHYNPSLLKVNGVFTVPSRLLNVVETIQSENSGGSSGETGGSTRVGGGGSSSISMPQCYGLDNGIVQNNVPTIKFDDENETPILNCEYYVNNTITDPNDNKEYRIVEIGFPTVGIYEHDQIEEIVHSEGTATYNNETYYYLTYYNNITGRIDEDGIFESGFYDNRTGEFITSEDYYGYSLPKVKNMTINVAEWDNNLNGPVFKTQEVSCLYWYSYDENDSPNLETYIGTLTITDNLITQYLIMPPNIINQLTTVSPTIDGISLASLNSIVIDGQSIDLTALVNNNGYMPLTEGTHTITYYFNPTNSLYETLSANTFQYVPIENLTVDSRFKCFFAYNIVNNKRQLMNAFSGCALLNTDEEVIKRICTVTSPIPFENGSIEPLVFECEFDNEDDYLVLGTRVFGGQDYFAIYNDKVGMHVCVITSSGGGDGPIK